MHHSENQLHTDLTNWYKPTAS